MVANNPSGSTGQGGGPATAVFPRYEQTFPALTADEIARMHRFGEIRTYKDGERLFETGKPGLGMFVVLSGHVVLTQRDGLGYVAPIPLNTALAYFPTDVVPSPRTTGS